MDVKKRVFTGKKIVYMMEACIIVGIMIIISCFFDYYFAMNDDVFINAIVSGRYSGTPDAHNVSMAIPLNTLLNGLNYISSSIPWFGLLLLFCQFGSLYLIVVKLTRKLENCGKWMYICLVFLNILFVGLMPEELVLVQYTYTAALLMASATICLFDIGTLDGAFFTRRKIVSWAGILGQYLLAFCMRAEIFLFLLPFALFLTVVRYYRENGIRVDRTRLGRWGLIWGSVIFSVAVMQIINDSGYARGGWKEYKKVDSYRTQLYDFLELPSYEENRTFFDSIELSETQYNLLDNYNFSLDERITAETLKKVVDHINEERLAGYGGIEKLYWNFFTLPLREGIWSYVHRCLLDPVVSRDDYPWNIVSILLLGIFLLLTFLSKRWINIFWMAGWFTIRSVLWMYIILKQRTPIRVTHSLFVMEIVCLLILVIEEICWLKDWQRKIYAEIWVKRGGVVLFFLALCVSTAITWKQFGEKYTEVVKTNEMWSGLTAYCHENGNAFYFIDVYSTVRYSERIFSESDANIDNYDICGGWLAKSPLTNEKYLKFGISSVENSLISNDGVFFVIAHEEPLDWLLAYYEEKGLVIEAVLQEIICGQFDVYKISAHGSLY